MKRTRIALLAIVLLVAGSCSGGDDEGGGGSGWTVLHYSMADTDLEPFMVADVNEMGEVGSRGGLQLRALVDRSGDYGEDPALDVGNWVGAKVLDIGAGTAEVVEDLGDVNSADPATLTKFIAEGIEALPAEHYAVIISDHGASWPGIGPDEGSDNAVLDLNEIVKGIGDGLEQAGVEKLDFLGFDACLMGSYEVASAVAPLADRLVASEELEPGHGWDYRKLALLADKPDTTTDQLGAALVTGFKAQATEQETDAAITLALIDLTKMGAVDDAVTTLAGALKEGGAEVGPVVGRAHSEALAFAKSPDETESSHMTDLGQLATAIAAEAPSVKDEATALAKAIDAAVTRSVDGEATQGASGLSIYFPASADLANGAYREVASASEWVSFLESFYAVGDAIPEAAQPDFTNADERAEVFFDEDGANIVGTFEADGAENLVDAVISYGLIEEDGSITYLGEEPGAIAEDGSLRAIGVYDLTALKISDGEDEAYAYVTLDYEDGAESYTIDVPMAYYAEGDEEGETYQDVLLSLTIETESGDILNETYYAYDEESGTYGELTADPEGIIVPEVLSYSAEGEEEWTSTTDVGLFAELEKLTYDLEPLDPGTRIQLDLTVFDYGDNSDTVSAQVTVPAA